jgi:O-antigen ligase
MPPRRVTSIAAHAAPARDAAWRRAEVAALAALLFVLPILEAPKNVLVVVFFAIWLARRFSGGAGATRRLDAAELAALSLLAVAAISTAINRPYPNQLKGIKDVLCYTLLFVFVYRSRFSTGEKALFAHAAVWGVVAGLAWGVADVWRGRHANLELHSVGVVTHSALYVGIVVAIAFWMVVAPLLRHSPGSPRGRAWPLWIIVLLVLLVGLFAMGSRGSVLAIGAAFGALGLLIRDWHVRGTTAAALVTAFVAVLIMPNAFQQSRLVSKVSQLATTHELNKSDRIRFAMWRIAVAQITQGGAPLFGNGPRNFSGIAVDRLHFDRPLAVPVSTLNHAHNWALNTLVEQGVAGLVALVWFLAMVARALAAQWRADQWARWPWSAAVAALIIPIVGGTFGTPWYQEHVWLAMILFGLALAPDGPPDAGRAGAPP